MKKNLPNAYFRNPVKSEDVIELLRNNWDIEVLVYGNKNLSLEGVCDPRNGGRYQLVFSSSEQMENIKNLTDSFVLIDVAPPEHFDKRNQYCVVSDPRTAFITLLDWLIDNVGVDAHERGFTLGAEISRDAIISASAIIEPGVQIGGGSQVCAGAVIKQGTRIGENTVIRENTVVGSDGVIVHRAEDGRLLKFPHVGGVLIGSNTEIGANAVVAGGILAPTFIGTEVVIGNLCNIGHGVIVEDGTWMSVGSLIGGHTTIRTSATIAMGCTIRNSLVIGEEASLGMGSVVVKDVDPKRSMFGNPAKRMAGLKTGPDR